jgi:hypothetical protein
MKRTYLVNDESSNKSSNQATPYSEKEKIETLKSNLYKQASLSKDCEQIERAINCFSQSPSESDDKQENYKQEQTFLWQLNKLCESFLYAGFLVTAFSYLVAVSGVCNSMNSKFCLSSQVIPNAISDYFSNQTIEPTSDR